MCDSKRRWVRESSNVSSEFNIKCKRKYKNKKKLFFTYKLFRQQNENKMWLMSCVNFFFSFNLPLLLRLASSSAIALLSRLTRVILGLPPKAENYYFFVRDFFLFFFNFFFWTLKSSNGNDLIFFFSCVHTVMCA